MARLFAYSTFSLSLFTLLVLSSHPMLIWPERSLLAGTIPLLFLYFLHLLLTRRILTRYSRKPSYGTTDLYILTGIAAFPSIFWISINFLIPFQVSIRSIFATGFMLGSLLGVLSGAWLAFRGVAPNVTSDSTDSESAISDSSTSH